MFSSQNAPMAEQKRRYQSHQEKFHKTFDWPFAKQLWEYYKGVHLQIELDDHHHSQSPQNHHENIEPNCTFDVVLTAVNSCNNVTSNPLNVNALVALNASVPDAKLVGRSPQNILDPGLPLPICPIVK